MANHYLNRCDPAINRIHARLLALEKFICPVMSHLPSFELKALLQADIYRYLMESRLHSKLAGYLSVIGDQTHRLPVALSHCGQSYNQQYIEALDRLSYEELVKVAQEVVGEQQAYYCAQRVQCMSGDADCDPVWQRLFETSQTPRYRFIAL